MEAEHEHKLIARAVHHGELDVIRDAGVTPKYFTDKAARAVFTDLVAFEDEFGAPPTADVLRSDHPTYALLDEANEPSGYLLKKLRENHRLALLTQGMESAAKAILSKDSNTASRALNDTLELVRQEDLTLTDVDYFAEAGARMERYEQRMRDGNTLRGVPTGLASLDAATGGLRPGQLITLIAPIKTGKTFLSGNLAKNILAEGYSVLFITIEMGAEEISERLDSYHSGVSSKGLRTAQLSEHEFKKLGRTMKSMKKKAGVASLVICEDLADITTVSQIKGKIDKYKPDVVIIDGLYQLTDERTGQRRDWQAMTNIVQDTKRMAQQYKLPVVATSQARRENVGGLTVTAAAYSGAFEQYSDVLLGAEKTNIPGLIKLSILASRVCPPDEYLLTVDYDKGTLLEDAGPDGQETYRDAWDDWRSDTVDA